MGPEGLPSPEQELSRYREHNNDREDERYRHFLNRLLVPFHARVSATFPPPSPQVPLKILDFGSGPVPVLGEMLRDSGYDVSFYDPFFAPQQDVLQSRRYHGIVCCETAEHFHNPRLMFQKLFALLHPGGTLGVMTTFLTEEIDFDRWYYRNDHTHVFFYRRATIAWIAAHWGSSVTIPRENVALFTTTADADPGGTSQPGQSVR